MGFWKTLRTVADIFTMSKITDQYGLGAGLLYSDVSDKVENENDLKTMKAHVMEIITTCFSELRQYMSDFVVDDLHSYAEKISKSDELTFNMYWSELQEYLNHKLAFFTQLNEFMQNVTESILSINDEDCDKKTKDEINAKIDELKSKLTAPY